MSDREKLISIIKKAQHGNMLVQWGDIADVLLKEGILLPPVKIDDKVYVVDADTNAVSVQTVICISKDILQYHIQTKCEYFNQCDCKSGDPCMAESEICSMAFTNFDIGKTVFFNEEDAHKKLKERKISNEQ